MEHTLIQGGEQYLPFARSRIKALRATGLRYASQRFEVDGASILVRIADDQDYITLNGGGEGIFSGVTRDGLVFAVPAPPGSPPGVTTVSTLQSYKPTPQAWQLQLKRDKTKSPSKFSNEPRLAITAATELQLSNSARPIPTQYNAICSSMYSGLMKKAAQIILGYGKPAASGTTLDGVQIHYDFRWKRCHGIAKGADGKYWLLEISQDNGVLLMSLPLRGGSQRLKSSGMDAVRHAVRLFGGLPSGDMFPAGDQLTAALASGRVLQLLTPTDMAGYFGKNAYSPSMGWSFNDDGSEAHNTCWYVAAGDDPRSCHYKLSITVGEVDPARKDGEPVVPASAALTLVEEGSILRAGGYSVPGGGTVYSPTPCSFADPKAGYFQGVPGYRDVPSSSVPVHKTPVFVCHIDNQLEVVYSEFKAINDISVKSNPATNPDGTVVYLNQVLEDGVHFGTCASSTRYPPTFVGQSANYTSYRSTIDTQIYSVDHGGDESVRYRRVVREQVREYDNDWTGEDRWTCSVAVWPEGTRDCYVFFEPALHSGVRPAGAAQDLFYVVSSTPISKAEYNALPHVPKDAPKEPPHGDWAYTDRPPVHHIVLGDGQLLDVEHPGDEGLKNQAQWGIFSGATGYTFTVRHSTFGPNKQLVATIDPMRIDPDNSGAPPPNNVETQLRLTGSMLGSEPNPAKRTDYSFVGYI